MEIGGLTLFGKHPAWSDHMFVSSDAGTGHHLKRIFYDHSIIPALQQSGDSAQTISEEWSFLAFFDSQVFCIVSVPSRDSVGRSRFPLMVACPLPAGLCVEAASAQLGMLKQELRTLLGAMLVFAEDNCARWQADVMRQAELFSSKVDWSSVDPAGGHSELSRSMLASLMTRLLDEHDALNLQSCSYAEACVLACVGLQQFKVPVPVLLVFDQVDHGQALMFAFDQAIGFRMQRFLHGNLRLLSVADDSISPQVIRLLGSSAAKPDDLWPAAEVPTLKIDIRKRGGSALSRNLKRCLIVTCIVVGALILSILIVILANVFR